MYTPEQLISHLETYSRELKALGKKDQPIEEYKEALKKLPKNNQLSAEDIQIGLALEQHPEGGFFREFIRTENRTVIFYLLPENAVSSWHSLEAIAETFKLISGATLAIPRISPAAIWQTEAQLTDNTNVTLKASKENTYGDWFGAYSTGRYSLVTCTCRPAFEYKKFKLAEQNDIATFLAKNNTSQHQCDTIRKLSPENALENNRGQKRKNSAVEDVSSSFLSLSIFTLQSNAPDSSELSSSDANKHCMK